jgi:hypothetical protein
MGFGGSKPKTFSYEVCGHSFLDEASAIAFQQECIKSGAIDTQIEKRKIKPKFLPGEFISCIDNSKPPE